MRTSVLAITNTELGQPHIIHHPCAAHQARLGECGGAAPLTILLPGFAFRYHRDDPFWDRLLAGRSADVLVTMDTPPWYLRAIYGDPVSRRWRRQVLGFCGFRPIRFLRFGPTRRGEAAKRIGGWRAQVAQAAATAAVLGRGAKQPVLPGRAAFAQAVVERQS